MCMTTILAGAGSRGTTALVSGWRREYLVCWRWRPRWRGPPAARGAAPRPAAAPARRADALSPRAA